MQALYCENGELTFYQNYPKPKLEADEALLRVTLAGICSTDLEIVKGYVSGFAGVLGHEFVGVVEAAADESWLGQRMVGSINIGCQLCGVCQQHGPEHCPERQVLGIHHRDGVFAEYVAVPLQNLYRVPEGVPDERAVFTEPLAAALQIREQVAIRPSQKTAVIGPGRLGLLVAQVLQLAGGDVTVLGRRAGSLHLPAAWGLQTGLVTDFADSAFDFIVEVTGNPAGFAQALRLIRPLGTLILKSTFAGESQLDLTKIVVDEITVIGSRCGPFAAALRLLAQDTIETDAFIMAEYPLHDALEALAKAAQPGMLKVLLRP
ncbi:Threonine dehydrogenase and related Zn-dependent dehydrogenases [hydrothermal vent metagenome]|uniref:Threonine dehydrogenase and related Zn-dependent dehydrogenases n=1 Tax=hydrothermal vent metagenome TaxID=652676 RepID=A0A3B0VBH2_9ZZZZ